MIIKVLLSGFFSFWGSCLAFAQLPAIGNWRDHLPYHQALRVVHLDQKIWCATPYSLFSVDLKDNSLERLSRTNGLSTTGISALEADSQSNKLIIAYTNSTIDILSGKNTFTISDIRQASVTGDKTVNRILAWQNQVFLSTGLGIVVLDEDKYEVKDTYILGNDGDTVAVYALATDGAEFYAATAEGLKQASVNEPDLADFHNWSLVSGTNGLGQGPCGQVVSLLGEVVILRQDSLFMKDSGGQWNFFYADGWQVRDLSVSEGKLIICEQQADSGRVVVVTGTGSGERTLQQNGVIQAPRQALSYEGNIWVADSVNGLSAWNDEGPERFIPNSPQSLAVGGMAVGPGGTAGNADQRAGVLWAASGGADSNWSPLHNGDGLFRLAGGDWKNYNVAAYPPLRGVFNFITVAIDPKQTTDGAKGNSIWAGSYGQGLLHIAADSSFTVYAANSPLGPVQGQPSEYRVSGLAFDPDGNLWIANYGAASDLLVKKTDGTWIPVSIPFAHTENAVSQVLADDHKQIWVVSPKGNGLFCYNPGASLDNTSDDQWKFYRAGQGNGNLPDNTVFCLAKDKSGFIWVGTANGIGVVQCTQQIFAAGGCEAVWPIVKFDGFAGYLFSGQQVQAIAVDGADRKWIGTRNGVWLISPDAQKIVYHFTGDNTPLLSNDVKGIEVDPQSGEVFFATAKGICSFRSTATDGGETISNVLVFPNPVPPDYQGTIAIRGLVDGAIVKITAMDGRLVYQTNALGGQAIWDGRDYKGRKVSTGVYLVLVNDLARQQKMATKIVFIGK
ncbi:type IX secretion system anionic LPS delivery protein PorZ [Flavitalea flava]